MSVVAWIRDRHRGLADAAVLIAIAVFMATYFPPSLLVLDTTPTGGDTPAHNYLLSHLAETLKSGRIISWAGGWWSGFPMYQFYFILPYFTMAVLSYVIPANIAFKIVSVLGIFALPASLYFAMRQIRRAPRALPILSAIAAVPFVFVQTHTMWGVNVKSTLAGMIANSWSFCVFALFLGFAFRDLEDRRLRISTAVLLALLFYSHFFTTLIAIMVIGLCVFLWGRDWWGRAAALLPGGIIGVLCAGFWLVPLMLKGAWSVEFGGDWDEVLLKTFPAWAAYVAPLVLPGIGFAVWKKHRVAGMFAIMLAVSFVFWHVGGRINSSFGNIRFWPFIWFAFTMLVVLGASYLIDWLTYERAAAVALCVIVLGLQSMDRDEVSGWYKWNMDGVERKRAYPILAGMMETMRGTPGRFVVDQTGANNRFGSDRIFEAFPAMIGKPFLVGGIVNSATGALFGYTVQCEISKGCAGFPKLVNAPGFDLDAGLRHLDLFSVSHFVAHYDRLQQEMVGRPGWTMVRQIADYQIFARDGGPTPLVYVPEHHPALLRTDNWKERAIEWFALPALLDRPFVFVEPGEDVPDARIGPEYDLATYFGLIADRRPDRTEIPSWSMVGPFFHEPELKKALDWNPTGEDESKLRPGRDVKGMTWRSFVREGKIDVDAMLNPSHHLVVYAFAGVYSDREQNAVLLFAHDDDVAAFWNGERIGKFRRHEPENPAKKTVRLREGRNDLIVKLNQGVGGAFYHVRIQTEDGEPVPGVTFGPDVFGASPATLPAHQPARRDCRVEILKFADDEVRFTTDCPGEPHIIKQSYYPNWKVEGASRIYQVSPNFQLVYPQGGEVRLFYGSTPPDVIGRVMTFVGYALLACSFLWKRRLNDWLERTSPDPRPEAAPERAA